MFKTMKDEIIKESLDKLVELKKKQGNVINSINTEEKRLEDLHLEESKIVANTKSLLETNKQLDFQIKQKEILLCASIEKITLNQITLNNLIGRKDVIEKEIQNKKELFLKVEKENLDKIKELQRKTEDTQEKSFNEQEIQKKEIFLLNQNKESLKSGIIPLESYLTSLKNIISGGEDNLIKLGAKHTAKNNEIKTIDVEILNKQGEVGKLNEQIEMLKNNLQKENDLVCSKQKEWNDLEVVISEKEKELQLAKEKILGLLKREKRINELIPVITDYFKKAGLEINID